MSPHHSATGTLNYPSQTSYATRPEQTWSTTSPHPLQPSQGPLGYAYRPPHDVDTFQYPGSTIPRADDARSALHLGPYDVPQDTPDKRPISSEEASPAASPRGRNLTLPPLRAGPTPAAPFASHVQSPTESHYVPPDVSAVQYYTTQNHPQIQHSPQLPPQAAVNYRYAHQVMEAGYYPSNVHPPQHPAYGRRVGDVASNTSSSGSTSVTPRTPIILPPPNHEMTPNGGKKNPLSIGHIVSDRA
ncbi:uncharacterized protein EI90DRAFT_889249 [Cantharellus anzutake]|uniref:uncharacterized protein n=1 Tax=Cantharellus anzutake TaxID=1750568 RepID=UPI001904FA99|nr:uncharacterized protein EI90DRAFT_889249 [Cantharellus anzutake]KAF8331845.1 hypothetical protein EI90DRAFT_889249 [Cantharellus anzutake]